MRKYQIIKKLPDDIVIDVCKEYQLAFPVEINSDGVLDILDWQRNIPLFWRIERYDCYTAPRSKYEEVIGMLLAGLWVEFCFVLEEYPGRTGAGETVVRSET